MTHHIRGAYERFVLLIVAGSIGLIGATLSVPNDRATHPTQLLLLTVAAMVLGSLIVPLKHGRLSLLAIPLFAATIVLSPWETALVSVAGNFRRSLSHASTSRRIGTVAGSLFWGTAASAFHALVVSVGVPGPLASIATIIVAIVVNWITAALFLALMDRVPISTVLRRTVDTTFLLAYSYFALAALLSASLIDESRVGWIQTSIFYLLSLTLAYAVSEHVAGDTMRQQLLLIDERIAFGQEAEAALHAVKNQLLLSSLYLEEIAPDRLTVEDRDALRIVFDSLQQSAALLRKTSASGRAANTPVYTDADLVELTRAVAMLCEARAAQQNIGFTLTVKAKEVPVYVDGLLIREILTNLVQNSLEACTSGGHIELSVGSRPDGTPFAEVTDDGPGLTADQASVLFASRTSSKTASGAGIGLTLSHAIATQHGGRLVYVRRRRGATFRLLLPPRAAARAQLSRAAVDVHVASSR